MRQQMVYIVIPVHNEREYITRAVFETIKVMETIKAHWGADYRIILSEDGSTDGSNVVCMQLSQEQPQVVYLHSDKRLGKGGALKKAVSSLPSNGIFFHIDADLSVHPRFIPPAIRKILDGYDIVIGSRWAKDSKVIRSATRKLLSLGYNVIMNTLFLTGIRDHQCGFKAFNLETTRDILLSTIDNKWFWDTEVLVRAKRAGLKIYEMPVEWIESPRDSKVSVWRDTTEMLMSAIKFRIKLWREKNE